MNAINHAATALLINRRWPGVPLVPVLICVQLIECLWVVLNLLGIEVTTTEVQVRSLADIHLAHMPYSHSVVSTIVIAGLVWAIVSKGFGRPRWGLALAVAVVSHLAQDLATHVADIQIAPGVASPRFGTGLYGVPAVALIVETVYGVFCWWCFRGSRTLLAVILAFNIGALSFYVGPVPGPESLLAGHPRVFAAVIGLHIVIGWAVIGHFARSRWRTAAAAT